MKILFVTFFLINFLQSDYSACFSQEWRTTVITDPAISMRCQALEVEREKKLKHKQRLMALQLRAKKLLKAAPANKISIKGKIENSKEKVSHELELSRLRIEELEEHIIRQGCPGIRF